MNLKNGLSQFIIVLVKYINLKSKKETIMNNKLNKKSISIFLALFLVFSISSCGKIETEETSQDNVETSTESNKTGVDAETSPTKSE